MENLLDEIYFALKEEHGAELATDMFLKKSASRCANILNERLRKFAKDVLQNRRCANCKFVENPCEIAQVVFYDEGLSLVDFGCTKWEKKHGSE